MHWIRTVLVFLCLPVLGWSQLTASFTTSPAANNNTITVCQGSTVLYTNTSTGTNASTNYNWNFQGGNPNNSNQIGPHNVTYNNPGNYTTTLNLGNGVTSQVNVTVVANNLNPSLTLTSNTSFGYSTSTMNGMTIFRRCGYNTGNFSFSDPTIASHPVGTTYALIWGDATPNGTSAPPISHVYSAQGYYNLTYQVTLPGGCVFTQNYLVYVGNSAPTISLTGSGASSCLPNPYSFQVGTQGSVPPGTVFQIIYNDGTPTTTLNGLNPNPQTINHVFSQTSCGVNTTIQNQTYNNSFSIQVLASNACSPQGTFAAIGPIAAGGSVNAVMSANPNTNVICVNQPITFNDVSNHGTNVSNGGCDSLFGRYWTISPNSGFTTSGTLGSPAGFLPNLPNGYDFFSWNNGSAALPVTWTVPGNYQVVLHLGNNCGMDSVIYNICVVAATVANFTLPQATACAPVNITPNNTSSTPGCNLTNVFSWAVTSTNPQNCNFNGGPSVQPANSALANPTFSFNGPGVYTIQLTLGLSNQVIGASCAQTTYSQQITIKGPPQFTINPVGPICAGDSISPTIVMNNCYGTTPNTYAWDFNPGNTIPAGSIPNPTSANTLNPGSITYPSSTGSPFPFNLTATNECGPTTVASTVVVNNPVVVTPGSYGPYCLNSPVSLNGTVTGGVSTGYWTANVAGGTFNPIGSGGANSGALISTYTPPSGYSGNIVLTLTSGQPPAPCPVVTAQTTITFNPVATVSTGAYPNGACMNGTLALNGSIGGAASSATWTSSVGGAFTPNANALNATWAPPVGFTGIATLTLTTNDPAGPCNPASASVNVTVHPLPVATAPQTVGPICSGSNAVITFTSTINPTSFAWTATFPAGVTGTASGTLNPGSSSATLTTAITNNTNAPQTVTYTFTPSSNGCPGSPVTTQVVVQPVATVGPFSPITVCPGATITPPAFVSNPNGATFNWVSSNPAGIGSPPNGSGQMSPWTAPANNSNTTVSSNIAVTPTYNNCQGTTASFVITINPTPTITNNNLSQSICSGSNTTAVNWTSNLAGTTYAWTGVASDPTVTGFTASGNGNLPFMAISNSSNTVQTVTYTVTPTRNGCSGPAITYTITVNPIPQLTLSQNQTVCGGVATVPSTFQNTVAGGSFTYTLQSPGSVPATITGHPVNGSGQVPAATINNAGTNPYTLNYTITPTANGCSGTSATYSITVNPAPVTTFSPANQSICSGQNTNLVTLSSSTAGVTFSWSIPSGVPVGMGNVNVTSGTSTIPAYVNLTNNTTAPLVLTIVAVATTGGASQCAGSPSNYTITVNPVPTALANFVSNDTVCSNTAVHIALSSNTPGTLFTWTAVNGPNTTGGSNSVNPGVSIQQTLVNSSTNFGSVTYTITPVVAGACPGSPIQVTAYVQPVATLAALASPTVCPQATVTPSNLVSTPNGASFAWTVSNAQIGIAGPGNGQIAPWTAPANNTNAPITGTVTVTPTYNGCVGTSSSFTVSINPTPTVTNNVLTQSICSGANTSAVTWTSNLAGTTYAWTGVASDPTVTGFTASGSGNLPVMAVANSSNAVQTVTYTVTPTDSGCVGIPITYTITVNPIPQLTLSQDQTVCGGVATVQSAFINSVAGGSFTYALQNPGAVPATVTGYPTNGSGQIPVATINNSSANPFTLTYTITPTANGCNGATGAYSITVNPAPAVTFSIPNQTVCNNGNSQAVTISSTTANTTFSWSVQNPLPNGLGAVQPTSGNTSLIPAFSGLTNNTNQPISFTVSATASTTGNAICPGTPNSHTITVNPTVSALATFVSNDTICNNTQLNLTLSSVTPTVQFTWTVVSPNGVTGASPSGAPSSTIQQTLTNATSAIATVTYTVTPQIGACNGTVLNVPVYVNPVAVMNPMANLTACPSQALSPAAFGSVPAPATFAWINSNQQVGIPGSGNGNIAPWNAPANNGLSNITSTVTVTPTYNGCVGTSSSFSITIYPTPTVTNSPLNQTVCEGVATSPITFTSNLNGSSFAWNYLASGANLSGFNAGNGSNPLPPMTVAHSGNTPQTVTYSVIPTSTNNCSGTAVTYTINVNPNPSVSNVVDQVICSGTSTTLSTYQNNVAGGGFTWSLLNANIPNTVTGFLAPSGSGQLTAAVVSNSGTQPYTLNYLITPNAAGCNGQPDTLSITVMPAPALQFTGGPNQSICSGQSTASINMTSTTPNVTWSWTVISSNNVSGVNPNSGSSATIPSFTLSQGTNTPQSVIISAQANTTNGGCAGAASTYTITVNPIPTVTPTVSPSSTICSGSNVTISLSSNVAGTTFAWTSSASAGISGNTNNSGSTITNTLLNATSNTGTVTYSITPTANACAGAVVTTTITVNPVAQMTGLNNISVCPGANIAPPAFQSIPAGASFTWTNSNTNIGIPASGQGNLVAWNAPINNTVNPIVGLIIVTPTIGNACAGVNDTLVVTVFPTPQITNAPLQQTLCEGSPTAPVNITSNLAGSTLTWNFSTAGGGLSGHPVGSGNNPIPAMTFSNNVSTQQTAQYTLSAVSTNQCPSLPVTYTFNVNPIPVLNNPGVQTVCSGLPTSQAAFTADVQGTLFTWTAITPPAGLSGFTASGTGSLSPMTITNATANPLQLVYSITPSASGCSGVPLNYTITVNPSPTVLFSLANQTICSGATTNLVNLTTSTNNATIAWSASVPGGLQGVNTLSGTTQIPAYSLINNTQGNLTATFTATASTAGGTVCPGVPSTYSITVSPQNGISVVAVDSSLCSGSNAQITISSNTAGLTYATTVAASQGITGASNVNGAQISQTLVNSGNAQGTVTYTVTATAPPGSSCPSQTAVLPITVEPVASIQYSIPSQSLCSGSSSQLVNLTSNVAGASIGWTASVPNGLSGMALQGSTTIPSNPLSSNLNASAVIGVAGTATINGCTGPVANAQITVFPNPGLTITPPNDTICSGVAAVSSLSSNVANTSFAWTVSSNPSITGASNGSGATINQVLTNNSAQAQSLTYNITTNGPGPNNGCPGQSGTFTVWVNPVASVGFSLQNQTLCSGSSSQAVNITSPTPNAQISWTANIPAGITGAVANGVNTIPVQSLVNTTQGPLTVVYSVNVATQIGNCQGQAATYSITVNPLPTLSFSQNNQVLCSGQNSSALTLQSNLNAGIPGTLNYSWSANQPAGISGMATSGTSTIPVQTLTNNTSAPVTLSYVATLTYTNNGIACNGTGGTYTITVNPLPQVTATIASPIICSNDTASICFTSPVANANFTWTVAATNGIMGAQNGTGACLNHILVNNLLTQGTAVYTVTASANNCTGAAVTATVSINPNPSVTQVNNIVVCPGQAIPTINFTSTPAGAAFTWTNSNQGIGLIGGGSGSIPTWQAPLNVSGGPYAGTISVSGTLNGCSGANMTFTVTVNPTPTLTVSPPSLSLCSGTNAVITCSSNVPSASLNWVQASTNASGASNGTGTAVNGIFTISQTLTATSNVPGNVVYTVTPSAQGCVGTPEQVNVTVNPIPVVTVNPGSQTICSGTSTSIVFTGNMQGISFGWTVSNNNNILGASAGANDSIVQLLTNTSTGIQQITYNVTPSLNGCVGAGVNVIVTVNPTPVLTANAANATICSGTSTSIALSSNVLNTTYTYTASPMLGVVGAGSGVANPIVQQLTNNTLNPLQVTYDITPSANTCDGAIVSVTITVNPVASVIPSQNSVTICSGQSVNVQLASNSPGALFNWTVSTNAQLSGQQAGSGASINQQITNASFAVQNFYYVVTPVFGVCPGTQDTIPVTVNPLPQITPGPAINTCITTPPFNLTGFSPAGGTWSGTGMTNGALATFSPSVAMVGQNQNAAFTTTLTYSYTHPVTGCINSATRQVTVNPLPIPSFTMDTLKCTNTTVSIVNNSQGANSYLWNFGNGATSTQVNPIYQFPTGGNYTVTLVATSPQGCVDSTSNSIQIVSTPTASFVPSPNNGCGPLNVNFNNTSSGYGITSYFWNFGFPANGPFSNAQNPGALTFQPPLYQDTNYIVSLSVTNLCGTVNFLDTILVHPLPIASFATTVNNGCSPLPVGFQNLSIGSPTNYIWNFGDGSFSTAVSPTHTFTYGPNDTIFNVALIAINACGSDTVYFPIHVFPNTVTSFFNTNPTVGCAPLNVQFTNFSQGGNLNYFWSFGNGQVSNQQSPSHLYTSAGTYIAQLVVDNGCSYDTSTISITVLPKPQVAFTVVDDTLCMGQNFQFTNLSSQLSNAAWLFGDGTGSNVYSPTHVYASAGNFTVALIGTSAANGCVDTAYRTITSIPSPVLNYDTLVFEGCAALSVSFNELSGTASSAVWDYGDGTLGIAPSSNHLYPNPGTYTPQVVAQNAFGCTDTADFTVVVHAVPVADFDVADKTSCDVPFSVTPVNLSQGAMVYDWDFGNGTGSNQFEPTAVYTQTGTYNLVLMAYNQFGCGDTTVQSIIVHPIANAQFIPDTTVGCEDLTVSFTNNSNNATSFLWNFGDGSSIQAQNPTHTYIDPGFYTVSLIVTNVQGCTDTLVQTNLIQVLPQPTAGFTVFPGLIYTEDPFLQLNNTAQNYDTGEYLMGNGAVVDIYTNQYNYGISDPAEYTITQIVYNDFGCSDTALAYIQILATPTLYVPNAFTPDADGENDSWIPVATAMYSIEVSVFNRWGEEVYTTTDLSKPWDGRYQGKDCPVGVYSWKIVARDVNQELIIQSGHISLLR